MVHIHQEALIDIAPEEVWGLLADFPNVYRWAPIVRSSRQTSAEPQGVGAGRSCSIPGFGDIVETIDRWQEGRSFSFVWTATGPVRGGRSTWSVEREGVGSRVTVDIDAEMRYGLLGELMGQTFVKAQMNRLMADALKGLEHHLRTGEEIDRAAATRLGLKAA